MAEQLGLRQRCLLGQFAQHRVQRSGPACNRCTREIKLGMVKKVAPLRLAAKAGPGVMHDPHACY